MRYLIELLNMVGFMPIVIGEVLLVPSFDAYELFREQALDVMEYYPEEYYQNECIKVMFRVGNEIVRMEVV